jgi:hypothetical protein
MVFAGLICDSDDAAGAQPRHLVGIQLQQALGISAFAAPSSTAG